MTIFIHYVARKRLGVSVDACACAIHHMASNDAIEKAIECVFRPSCQEPQQWEIISMQEFDDH